MRKKVQSSQVVTMFLGSFIFLWEGYGVKRKTPPIFFESSQVIRLIFFSKVTFLFLGSRGDKNQHLGAIKPHLGAITPHLGAITPLFGSNQNTFGRSMSNFPQKPTIIPSGMLLRPCLAGLLPEIFHILVEIKKELGGTC